MAENLAFFGRVYGLRGDALAERQEELLAWAGLADQRRALTADLGGGLRQRLAFACAILHRPALLLLDEAAHCDRLAMINAGRLVAVGTPRELREAYAGGGGLEQVFVNLARMGAQ